MGEASMRERMLAVIRGGKPDRVPFVQYDNVVAPNEEVWSLVGHGNMGVLRWLQVYRIEHPNCSTQSEGIRAGDLRGDRTTLETPRGVLTQERLHEPALGTASIRKHFVEAALDYEALLAYLDDSVVVEDTAALHRAEEELGENGLPLVRLERTPFQQLWVQWVGIGNLALHMQDCPDRVEACVKAMAAEARKTFEVACRVPVPFVNFPDNITAPVIGEANFRRYCVPLYDEMAGMLEDKGTPVFVHMDGDLKALWGAIGGSRVEGIDSLSPPPDNDTSVADAVAQWPKMRLLVNFPSSVHLASGQQVYEQAGTLLQEGGHTGRLQIQISENPPPGAWRVSYPEIVRAIMDYGRP